MDSPIVFALVRGLICFSPVALPLLCYFSYGAYKTVRKGWFIAILMGIVLYIGIPLFFMELIPGTSWYFDRQYTKSLTGVSFTLGAPVYAYETQRHFNGDGYSILVYQLSDEVIAEFENPSTDFFNHPTQPEYRREWEIQAWQRKPIAEDVTPIIDFALAAAPEELEMKARASLDHPETYHAYLFFQSTFPGHSEPRVLNVDFFILDIQEKLFYVVNHNT